MTDTNHSERAEHQRAWLEWLKENDGLAVTEWLVAYSGATQGPAHNEDAKTICRFIDARMLAAAAEIERLTKERDEARRWVCDVRAEWNPFTAKEIAIKCGWDCFKEEGTP